MSPISSRNSVPPLATSICDGLLVRAVKAPFSWRTIRFRADSRESRRSCSRRSGASGARSGRAARVPAIPCRVPLSPSSSTEMSVVATFQSCGRSFSMVLVRSDDCRRSASARAGVRGAGSRARARPFASALDQEIEPLHVHRLLVKSKAPKRTALSALSRSALPSRR